MNYYLNALSNFAKFSGRAQRVEYWMFALISSIVSVIFSIIGAAIHFPLLGLIYDLVVLVPTLAVLSRRLHDTGKSAWWILILLVPLAGAITLLVFVCLGSTPGPNKYGPNPKAVGGALPGQHPFSHV